MPQMAPLNWLMLFLFFVLVYIMFNLLNFYSFIYEPKKSQFSKSAQKINWKW